MVLPPQSVTKKGRILNHLVGIFNDFLKSPSNSIIRPGPSQITKIIYLSQKQDDFYFATLTTELFRGARDCKNEEEIKQYLKGRDVIKRPLKYGLGKRAVKKLLSEIDLDAHRVFWIPKNYNPFYCGNDEATPIYFHSEEIGYSRCINCMREFFMPNPFQLYCSPKCRRQAEFGLRKRRESTPKKCICGKTLPATSRSHKKFCSVKCRVAYHRQQKI